MKRMGGLTVVAAAAAVLLAVPVSAQDEALKPVAAWGGISAILGLPTGDFQDYIEAGGGLNANIVWPVKRESPLALRADLGFLVYGDESKRVCFGGGVGCRIQLDVSTTNSIFFANVGPQLMMPTGALRPYVNAGVGFSYFSTTSSVAGSSGNEDFASTNNFDDATMQWAAGGGLLVRLSRGKVPVMLDLGARYNSNGSVEYLKEGDIRDNPDGSISFTPTRSEANLVTINLGVSIGIRPDNKK